MKNTRQSVTALWINGTLASAHTIRQILSINIKEGRNKAKSGEVVFRDADTSMTDARIFRKGKLIHWLLGWSSEAVPVGPFVVKKYKTEFPENGDPVLKVSFQDLSHKLDKKQKKKKRTGRMDQIIASIAEEHGLGYDISDVGDITFDDEFPLHQASMSDAKLLQVLANRYGFVWSIEGGNLVFETQAKRQLKKKGNPRVLSYRINDCSLKSFSPEVKYSKLGKRKRPNIDEQNLDFLGNNGSFGEFAANILAGDLSDEEKAELFAEHPNDAKEAVLLEESIGKAIQDNLGDDVRMFYHEAVDSAERLISFVAGTGYQTIEEARGLSNSRWENSINRDVQQHVDPNRYDDPDCDQSIYDDVWELEHSDMTLAYPSNTEEIARRRKARVAKTREIVSGTAVPTVASLRYHSGETIVIAGAGIFYSGEYLIKEVEQTFGSGGIPIKTSLKISRTRLGPTERAHKFTNEQEESVRNGSLSDGSEELIVAEPEFDEIQWELKKSIHNGEVSGELDYLELERNQSIPTNFE
jgi:hypothetical protein